MTLEEQIRAQGGDWNIGGVDRAAELAALLRQQGVTSLDGLSLAKGTRTETWGAHEGGAGDQSVMIPAGSQTSAQNQIKIGGKTLGFLGDYNNDGSYGTNAEQYLKSHDGSMLGWSATGDGNVGYHVMEQGGKTYLVPSWGSSSDLTPNLKAFLATAGAIGGAGYLAAGSGTGGALSGMDLAADAAIGTGNNISTAGGLLSGGTVAAAPTAGAYGAGLGADSAAGLVAPGAAGSGGAVLAAPGAAGGLAGAAGAAAALPSWLPEGLAPAWDFISKNPKLIGALAGGLLGGASGGADEPAPYTGPMPTIKRGGWNAAPTGYDPSKLAPGGGGLLNVAGQQQPASGLGRYMGLLGR